MEQGADHGTVPSICSCFLDSAGGGDFRITIRKSGHLISLLEEPLLSAYLSLFLVSSEGRVMITAVPLLSLYLLG